MTAPDPPHRVRLRVLEIDREVTFPMPPGSSPVSELLPSARAIVDAVADVGHQWAKERGERISCGPRCSSCCYHIVPVSLLEAASLVSLVEALPEPLRVRVRARFDEAVARLEAEGILDAQAEKPRRLLHGRGSSRAEAWRDASLRYFTLRIGCPLLEDDQCVVYADRPLTCREYLVTSEPELCGTLGGGTVVPRPVDSARVLSLTSSRLAPVEDFTIPLVLALEWAERLRGAFSSRHDGETMLASLIESFAESDRQTS
ncbi:MAG: hypothetical protein IT379_17235 [Deltaproteobacteria bacterium]|nr:hypothetical protein [Deltaproteobacteria bacterium]